MTVASLPPPTVKMLPIHSLDEIQSHHKEFLFTAASERRKDDKLFWRTAFRATIPIAKGSLFKSKRIQRDCSVELAAVYS
jgi:hypothetical protein